MNTKQQKQTMDAMVLKRHAENKIEELNFKIQQMKSRNVDEEVREQYEEALSEMKEIRDKVLEKFNEYDHSEDIDKWDTFDKQIYTDMESFDEAYTQAGGFLR